MEKTDLTTQAAAPAVDQSAALMQIIERVAMDKEMDIDKLERMLDLKRQWDADNARKSFSAAMAEFQARCPTINKSRRADRGRGGSYQYAPLDEIMRTIRPHLDAAGLSVRFDSEVNNAVVTAVCYLSHREGHTEVSRFAAPIDASKTREGNYIMNVTQQIGSANSYCKRYALCNALNLAGSEIDDDAQSASSQATIEHEPATAEQLAVIADYREAGQIPEATESWIKKQGELTTEKAAALINRLKKAETK